jgi:hypothetical protein
LILRVLDAVLRAVDAELAARPPERGGALLGPPGRPLVTRFVADPGARGTSSSWAPSRALAARVQEVERAEALELKGLVHSHPPGLERPSEGDRAEIAEALRRNDHLASFLSPIVTAATGTPPRATSDPVDEAFADAPLPAVAELGEPRGEPGPHQLPLPHGTISFFAGWRAAGGADVRPVEPRVLPLLEDLERVARALPALEDEPGRAAASAASRVETFLTDVGEAEALPAGAVALAGGAELLAIAGDAYPALPPLLLLTEDGPPRQLEVQWALGLDGAARAERLAAAVRAATVPRDALLARSAGLLPASVRERAALVAGCGSVGSYLAEGLARAGVARVALVDPERIEAANLSRTVYVAADVGAPKVEALARRLRAVSPSIAVEEHPSAAQDLAPAALDRLVREADVVVAATDDPAAQRALDRFAYARGRPAVFVGLYAGAEGGEVVVTSPDRTACYRCATRTRHLGGGGAGGVERQTDYGTGRLAAQVALAADIQHVASAALKLALSLLVRGDPAARLAAFAEEAIASGATYLTLSTVPRYWFYPRIFGDAAGQGAYQSVWLTPVRGDDCPTCGPPALRDDPLAAPLRAPSHGAFDGLRGDR